MCRSAHSCREPSCWDRCCSKHFILGSLKWLQGLVIQCFINCAYYLSSTDATKLVCGESEAEFHSRSIHLGLRCRYEAQMERSDRTKKSTEILACLMWKASFHGSVYNTAAAWGNFPTVLGKPSQSHACVRSTKMFGGSCLCCITACFEPTQICTAVLRILVSSQAGLNHAPRMFSGKRDSF